MYSLPHKKTTSEFAKVGPLDPLSSALEAYSIQFAGQHSAVRDRNFRWTAPDAPASGNESLFLKDNLGRVSAAALVPIAGPFKGTPSDLTPRFVQAGGTAMILGDFGGDSRTTAIEIAERPAPVLAECSHYAVVRIPPEAVGDYAIQCHERWLAQGGDSP